MFHFIQECSILLPCKKMKRLSDDFVTIYWSFRKNLQSYKSIWQQPMSKNNCWLDFIKQTKRMILKWLAFTLKSKLWLIIWNTNLWDRADTITIFHPPTTTEVTYTHEWHIIEIVSTNNTMQKQSCQPAGSYINWTNYCDWLIFSLKNQGRLRYERDILGKHYKKERLY